MRFTDATVQWPKTWPSLASFLTGSYPRSTGIGAVPRVLPSSLLMLGEVFQSAGYDTAAVVSNFNAGRALGFDQGFDRFVESWQEKWEEEAGTAKFVNAPGKVKEYTNARLVTVVGRLYGIGCSDACFYACPVRCTASFSLYLFGNDYRNDSSVCVHAFKYGLYRNDASSRTQGSTRLISTTI